MGTWKVEEDAPPPFSPTPGLVFLPQPLMVQQGPWGQAG